MGFLDSLSDSLLDQVGLSENTPSSLDTSQPGDFGVLGDFASKIDKSAYRSYVETGQIRNIRPRASEILMQEPDITVVIKKRIFSSLAENFKPELMEEDDKLFLRATKRLFENKCRIIAAYERLTKFERVVSHNDGMLNDVAFPMLFTAIDSLNAISSTTGINILGSKTQSALESIRNVKKFSDPAFFTTWNINKEIPYATDIGDGTGTFDLTLVQSVTCKNSVELGQGNCTLTIEDPYKLMIVNNNDIEIAISDATSLFKQRSFFKVTEFQLKKTIEDLKTKLNSIRGSRGATRIFFKIAEESLLFKKVRAFIDNEGREIKFTFEAGLFGIDLLSTNNDAVSIAPESYEGINGLRRGNSEADFFKQIVQNIFTLMGLQQTTRSENKKANKLTSSIRRKMQLHYGNKAIIQPMDVVYVFIGSKMLKDSKITQGLNTTFSGGNLVNKINQTIGNIESAFDDISQTFSGGMAGDTAGGDGSSLEIEKNLIAGPDFPIWLYQLMRNDFTRQAAGVCTFVGTVDTAPHDYSGGKYVLTVNVKDNSNYFKVSQINVNPSVDVYNGALYDPLTPFNAEFDESTGFLRGEVPPLLDANVRLLNSRSVRSKLGRFRGSELDEVRYALLEIEHITSGGGDSAKQGFSKIARRNFVDPDGFVYRWKEGIGSLVLFGEPHSDFTTLGSFRSEASPNITKNPFAGQDVMNVLSLLITGVPYNYNNFVRGALDFAKLQKDDLKNEDMSQSFFKGLISDITKQNAIWGSFMPFKKLVVNERAYEFLASGEFDLTIKNAALNKKLRERAIKFDEFTSSATQFSNIPQWYPKGSGGKPIGTIDPAHADIAPKLQKDIIDLDTEIAQLEDEFKNRVSKQPNLQGQSGTLSIIGDDISFDPTVTGSGKAAQDTEEDRLRARRDLRKRTNALTRRRIWKVRGNSDTNLFIVDDTYDKNYDIRAFEQALTSRLDLFNSTYSGISDQITQIKKLLGLEVFADSQGHIQARPPQYNKMPSSVFRNMLQQKAERGIRLFPSFLEKLFFNSVQGVSDRIEIVEDQIRLRAAALGFNSDTDTVRLLNGGHLGQKTHASMHFRFLTSPQNGKLGGEDIRVLFEQNLPDLQEENAMNALEKLSAKLSGPLNATINFDIIKRSDIVNDEQTFKGNEYSSNSAIKNISNRLRRRLNQDVPSSVQAILSNRRVTDRAGKSQADILRVLNQISRFVGERQRLIKTLSNSIRNLREGMALNSDDSSSAKALLMPNIRDTDGDVLFPRMLEHMIEDENNDDFGPRAGRRFILSDDKIISLNIVESAPDYNMVQVDGKLEVGLVDMPGGLDVNLTGQSGGNAIGTAWAVDYDLWRMYGFRGSEAVNAPYFSDPNTQCAPFAVYLLNLARKNIFKGSVTVVGNEYIQAGEVYYIEDRDLLFYASSVTHSFTYNGQYNTNIELTYGHNPGEYIPTHLDIIGKGLYSNRHQSELVRQVRHGHADGSTPLTIVTRDTSQPVNAIVKGQFADQNVKNLANMVLATTGLLTPTQFGKELNIELRIYSNTDPSVYTVKNSSLETFAETVKDWVVNPEARSINGEKSLTFSPETDDGGQGAKIDDGKINVVPVDLNPNAENETKSPSSGAWSMARSIAATSSYPNYNSITAAATEAAEEGEISKAEELNKSANILLGFIETQTLINQIVDVWITFKDPTQTSGTSKNQDEPTNQADQQEQEKVTEAQSNSPADDSTVASGLTDEELTNSFVPGLFPEGAFDE